MTVTYARKDWGVVEELNVVADTDTSLAAALTIAMTYHGVDGFGKFTDAEGLPHLVLYSSKPSKAVDYAPLITMAGTDGESLRLDIKRWLASCEYGPAPNIDGSTKKGFRVYLPGWAVSSEPNSDKYDRFYVTAIVAPAWTMYGK